MAMNIAVTKRAADRKVSGPSSYLLLINADCKLANYVSRTICRAATPRVALLRFMLGAW
jgi:hypothetical protein